MHFFHKAWDHMPTKPLMKGAQQSFWPNRRGNYHNQCYDVLDMSTKPCDLDLLENNWRCLEMIYVYASMVIQWHACTCVGGGGRVSNPRRLNQWPYQPYQPPVFFLRKLETLDLNASMTKMTQGEYYGNTKTHSHLALCQWEHTRNKWEHKTTLEWNTTTLQCKNETLRVLHLL